MIVSLTIEVEYIILYINKQVVVLLIIEVEYITFASSIV